MKDQELMQKLRMCGHHLYRMSDGRMSQRRILGLLAERGELSQRDLQELLDVRSASASEVLGKIEAEGLIERQQSEEDRRTMRVRLSDAGRAEAETLRAAHEAEAARLFACLTEEEKEQLGALLTRLQEHWRDDFAPVRPPHGRPPRGRGPHGPHDDNRFEGHHGPRDGRGPHDGERFDGRHDGPRRFETLPGRYDDRAADADGERFDGSRRFETLPGRYDDRAENGDGERCIHNCAICPLKAEGRCVKRGGRRV